MTLDQKRIILNTDRDTLAKWWCDLNNFKGVKELNAPVIDPDVRHFDGSSWPIMDFIERVVGIIIFHIGGMYMKETILIR